MNTVIKHEFTIEILLLYIIYHFLIKVLIYFYLNLLILYLPSLDVSSAEC